MAPQPLKRSAQRGGNCRPDLGFDVAGRLLAVSRRIKGDGFVEHDLDLQGAFAEHTQHDAAQAPHPPARPPPAGGSAPSAARECRYRQWRPAGCGRCCPAAKGRAALAAPNSEDLNGITRLPSDVVPSANRTTASPASSRLGHLRGLRRRSCAAWCDRQRPSAATAPASRTPAIADFRLGDEDHIGNGAQHQNIFPGDMVGRRSDSGRSGTRLPAMDNDPRPMTRHMSRCHQRGSRASANGRTQGPPAARAAGTGSIRKAARQQRRCAGWQSCRNITGLAEGHRHRPYRLSPLSGTP
jgi:hypothetical protein